MSVFTGSVQKLGRLLVEQIEIAHGSNTGYIVPAADFFCGNSLFESEDDISNKPAGNSVIARKEGVLFEKSLATVTAIAPLTQVQEGTSG